MLEALGQAIKSRLLRLHKKRQRPFHMPFRENSAKQLAI